MSFQVFLPTKVFVFKLLREKNDKRAQKKSLYFCVIQADSSPNVSLRVGRGCTLHTQLANWFHGWWCAAQRNLALKTGSRFIIKQQESAEAQSDIRHPMDWIWSYDKCRNMRKSSCRVRIHSAGLWLCCYSSDTKSVLRSWEMQFSYRIERYIASPDMCIDAPFQSEEV